MTSTTNITLTPGAGSEKGSTPLPRAHHLTACTALLTLFAAADAATEAPPVFEARATLIDDQLAQRPITVISLDDHLLTFLDEQQRRRTLARSAFLAFIPEQPPDPTPLRRRVPPRTAPGMLELTDTQRFPGDLFPAAAKPEALAWNQPILGRLDFPLERVWSFSRPTTPELRRAMRLPGTAVASDVIHLTNGDRLTGFLAAAADPITLESEGARIELPIDRIAAAQLANARQQPLGTWIWLADGTVARVMRFAVEHPGRVSIALESGPTASLRWDQVRAVVLDAARLRPLARIDPDSYAPAEGRRFAPPARAILPTEAEDPMGILSPPLDAADILLPGPMRITWTLPPDTRRLAFTAALADSAAPWGDCELVVRADDTELLRKRLHKDSPTAPISIPIEGRTLTISVEPGRFGPIRDWITLTRPILLINHQSNRP